MKVKLCTEIIASKKLIHGKKWANQAGNLVMKPFLITAGKRCHPLEEIVRTGLASVLSLPTLLTASVVVPIAFLAGAAKDYQTEIKPKKHIALIKPKKHKTLQEAAIEKTFIEQIIALLQKKFPFELILIIASFLAKAEDIQRNEKEILHLCCKITENLSKHEWKHQILQDSGNVITVFRPLTRKELSFFSKQNKKMQETKILASNDPVTFPQQPVP